MSGTLEGSRHENLAQDVETGTLEWNHFSTTIIGTMPPDFRGLSKPSWGTTWDDMESEAHAAAPADFEEFRTWLTLFSNLPPRLEEICDPTHHSTRFPKDRRNFGQKVPLR
ncbi:hypothetical protein PAAG_05728 [Paracoccidioides lutzii Pb01]|uniref:Uncharacterized protein n=1 Tax=Paracoccidioides lutzii (strain ATCC MYA-826 / Pb01) TaxID=502779 RepID=C1H4N5_PARBA|nr:hypothetical protein PAAG_05728 [Paracoccidioides lutzii Pb01]EEH34679.2 hypothetical protein PAAG_05728 [Paracoccidioides lutzii Pb01]